jgi:hypothetical protein
MNNYWNSDFGLCDNQALSAYYSCDLGNQGFDEEFYALTNLWREVIKQAFKDIQGGSRDALYWLESKDFEKCCQLAHIDDPEVLREALLRKTRRRGERMAA